jgi:hypothetical protein
LLDQLRLRPPPEVNRDLQNLANSINQLAVVIPYLRLLGIIAIVFGIGLVIALALNRRLLRIEEESFVREAASEYEDTRSEKLRRARARPAPFREIEAENIRRVYAALLARAEASGLARREAETPLEFLPRLIARWPEAAPDLNQVTQAYVAVHYAQQSATREQVREVRAAWERLKNQLVLTKRK